LLNPHITTYFVKLEVFGSSLHYINAKTGVALGDTSEDGTVVKGFSHVVFVYDIIKNAYIIQVVTWLCDVNTRIMSTI